MRCDDEVRNNRATTVIELADEDAAALKAKATAAGPSLEAWLKQLARTAEDTMAEPAPRRPHIAEIIQEIMKDVPPEVMATMPTDGASQHDHYSYGWPKRDV